MVVCCGEEKEGRWYDMGLEGWLLSIVERSRPGSVEYEEKGRIQIHPVRLASLSFSLPVSTYFHDSVH